MSGYCKKSPLFLLGAKIAARLLVSCFVFGLLLLLPKLRASTSASVPQPSAAPAAAEFFVSHRENEAVGTEPKTLSSEDLVNAIALLESIGVPKSSLCHPTSNMYEPYLSYCDFSTSTNLVSSLYETTTAATDEPATVLSSGRIPVSGGGSVNTPSSSSARGSSSPSWTSRILSSNRRHHSVGRYLLEGVGEEGEAATTPLVAGESLREGGCGEEEGPHNAVFIITHALCAFVCVTIAALAAGLTMGLLSLDPLLLLIKMRAGSTQVEKDQAASLLPIVKQHHLLLVTLLLLNSMANEALPLFLEVLVSPVMAVILSVTFVLFFGEIIPSAVFTGPNKIAIASKMTPIVRAVMFLLYPIAYPIAKALDHVLHDDDSGGGSGDEFNRGELSALVRIQYEERMANKQQRKKERAAAAAGGVQDYDYSNHVGGLDFSSSIRPSNNSARASSRQSARAFKREIEHRQSSMLSRKSDTTSVSMSLSGTGSQYGTTGTAIAASAAVATAAAIPDLGKLSTPSITSITTTISPSPTNARTTSIHLDEVAMVEGALQMKTKMAFDVFTPLHRVYAIPLSLVLDEANIVTIYSRGYSRVPVYDDMQHSLQQAEGEKSTKTATTQKFKDKTAICGVLMTRQLMIVNPTESRPVSTLPLMTPMCVSPKLNLVDLLNLFQTGTVGHMALVCARPEVGRVALEEGRPLPEAAGFMGVITIEDVIEELLQEEIYDESDKMERAKLRIAEWAATKWKKFVKKKKRERLMHDQAGRDVSMSSVVTQAMQQQRQMHGAQGDEESGAVPTTTTPLIGGGKKEDKTGFDLGSFFGFKK